MTKLKDETLKRVAIQIVAQLPGNTKDAKRVLELAERLMDKIDKPWKKPRSNGVGAHV